MRGISKSDTKLSSWKEKAKERRKRLDSQRRRIRELKKSREGWKSKYRSEKLRADRLSKQLATADRERSARPRGHKYTTEAIQLCVQLREKGNCSLRGCVQILAVLSLMFRLTSIRPSPSSIRNWEVKMGYYQITESPVEKEPWAVMLDESISVGRQKMLLMIGIKLKGYQFGKAPGFGDVHILGIWLGTSWKSEQIAKEVEGLVHRGYDIRYAISDNGNNLRKSLRISGIPRVEDCTHSLGKLMEHRYKSDSEHLAFTKRAALFKRQVNLSDFAQYMPPKQRVKGRFLNLSSISRWATKLLGLAQQYQQGQGHKEAFEKIKWVLEYSGFIVGLRHHQELLNGIFRILKPEGLCRKTYRKCLELLETGKVGTGFKEKIKAYLERNMKVVPEFKQVICCSDIIESIFGKLKNRVSSNPEVGMTESCLAISNSCSSMDKTKVKKAMEKVRMVDIQDWRKDNLPISLQQKKNRLFKKTG